MNKWVKGERVARWVIHGRTGEWKMDRHTDVWINGKIQFGQMNGWMGKRGTEDGQVEGEGSGRTGRWGIKRWNGEWRKDGWTDGWINAQMDEWMGG